MPTISVTPADLHALLGRTLAGDELTARLAAVKGEWKGEDPDTGQWRIELNDTNRPDLWSAEGIARQLRTLLDGKPRRYPVFTPPRAAPKARIVVDAKLRPVRPYIAAVLARGIAVTEPMLLALIQTQEKLAEGFGKRRRDVSVGLYNAGKIAWPVDYAAARRDEVRFVPLGFEQEMTPGEILARHPKGVAYASILAAHDVVPLLRDAKGTVLSLAPIINSRALGEVKPGDRDLMVEVTGTNLRSVILACNIFSADLTDRGFRCEPVAVAYPWDTECGRDVVTPRNLDDAVTLDIADLSRLLGEPVAAADAKARLVAYGCRVSGAGKGRLRVACPPWRMDYLHPMDALEDYAMARGYESFAPLLGIPFTVGAVHETTRLTDRVRDRVSGAGLEETMGNVRPPRRTPREGVRAAHDPTPRPEPVALANPTSELVGAMRDALLPGLLRLEAASPRAAYPHRVFEVGEVHVPDSAHPHGSRTAWHAAALWAAPEVAFSDLHALLEALSAYLGWQATLAPEDRGLFIPGRAATIRFAGTPRGSIGEVHPEVLDTLGIRTPVVALELALATVPEMA